MCVAQSGCNRTNELDTKTSEGEAGACGIDAASGKR